MISCKSGVTIRTSTGSIREAGRNTQGVKLIRLDETDEIAAITKLDKIEVDEEEITEEGTINPVANEVLTSEEENVNEESEASNESEEDTNTEGESDKEEETT